MTVCLWMTWLVAGEALREPGVVSQPPILAREMVKFRRRAKVSETSSYGAPVQQHKAIWFNLHS